MNFGKFVLQLRYRLQDRRDVNGNNIADISTSGRRWSADELVEICNSAMVTASKYIYLYSKIDEFVRLSDISVLSRGVINIVSGEAELPQEALILVSLSSSNRDFSYRSPAHFFSLLNDTASPVTNSYYYTTVFDVGSNKRKLYVFPTTFSGSVTYIAIHTRHNYTTADSGVELSLQGFDDLLLDIAERECRDREHNWERSQILDLRIMAKLGIKTERQG